MPDKKTMIFLEWIDASVSVENSSLTREEQTSVMCKCGDIRELHYNNWREYTGCGNKLNCGCSQYTPDLKE